MWWSDRRFVLCGLAALALAGCGFTPAYAPGGVGSRLQGRILPDEPQTVQAFAFANQLENRLGRAADAPYALSYDIDLDDQGLAITSDQETLRYHLSGVVDYRVSDRATGEVLTTGQAQTFAAYSAIGTTVATRAAERDAEKRLMVMLADQVVTQLLASGGRWLP
ncbi:LPS assembly lipoprotein LptE [Tropicimonas sp.]|uniref:LPS assembly lipoprotein LptE n=1 Tax=Tropicimonas sp. TaxID=2067044 RepID=UPI003A8C72E1